MRNRHDTTIVTIVSTAPYIERKSLDTSMGGKTARLDAHRHKWRGDSRYNQKLQTERRPTYEYEAKKLQHLCV